MQDPLLYRPLHRIPVSIIKLKVSQSTGIPLSLMLLSNKVCTARKREYVTARQISMTLSMKYSHKSLSYVGMEHGGRDHATVMHAVKSINNLLDIKDDIVVDWFARSKQALKDWDINNNSQYNKITSKAKTDLVKNWIKNKVPLFIREKLLNTYGIYCNSCGQLINKKL